MLATTASLMSGSNTSPKGHIPPELLSLAETCGEPWAAAFNPGLVERMAHAIGASMRRVGDPYLVATTGTAYVRDLESAGIIATFKHFAGYSASKAARDHAPVSMGPREFADVILPPFETAIREGGARSVMNSHADVDGMPAGADPLLPCATGRLQHRHPVEQHRPLSGPTRGGGPATFLSGALRSDRMDGAEHTVPPTRRTH
ncbi:hypothetical protein GCM10010276_32040 [Streptomyces longisporus]|uniref:Glycoside hydrolase family 3 N-terminal domain-containing protein n=1 Tax=Streptomyces longisporus TaxID=1948 RepID=A0ABN3LUC2_STRLO